MNYFIFNGEFYYTRILLFSWDCYLQPVVLSQTNGEFFAVKVKEKIVEQSSSFVVNCNNVLDVEDHFTDRFFDIIESKLKNSNFFVFYSNDGLSKLVKYISEHINRNKFKYSFIHEEEDSEFFVISKKQVCSSEIKILINKAKLLEGDSINSAVLDSYTETKSATGAEILPSTPLRAMGQFNATSLISDPSQFRWIVLMLVEKIYQLSKKEGITNYSLVAGSLRGAAIAGSVWELLQQFDGSITIQIVDHVGPYHDVAGKRYDSNAVLKEQCIYIGDFIIAGTEVKLLSAYCNFMGAKLIHAFVIGKYTEQSHIDKKVELHSLVDLKKCKPDLEYKLV